MVRARRWLVGVEGFVAVAGAAGAVQLFTGTFTPPVSDLEPLGLTSWRLPAVWLFASVAVPSALAAWFVWRDDARALAAVCVASALLVVELLVQIPFIGPSALQVVMGTLAVTAVLLARRTRPMPGVR